MQNIIHCPVCGKLLKAEKICSGCGYDLSRDYEIYPTLCPLPEGTASISVKRLEQLQKTEQMRTATEKAETKHKKSRVIIVPVLIAAIALAFLLATIMNPGQNQKKDDEGISQDTKSIEVTDIKEEEKQSQVTESLQVGDIFTFGAYEQDNDTSNGKEEIEWIILDKDDKSLLLISKYALDCQPYNETYTDVTWETCTLRKWLNSTFLSTAFSDDERKMIPSIIVSADQIPSIDTDQGNSTLDQVFLLSISEAEQYFNTDEKRRCAPTTYTVMKGAYTNIDYKQDGRDAGVWWLRNVGSARSSAASVDYDGGVNTIGRLVDDGLVGVRPALWVNLETENK